MSHRRDGTQWQNYETIGLLPQQFNKCDFHGSKSPGRRFIRMMITALQQSSNNKSQAFPAPKDIGRKAGCLSVDGRQEVEIAVDHFRPDESDEKKNLTLPV